MAKSKKNRQKDFQKVKLKVGKTLPKGQNVTDTSFKSQSIQLREQLRSDTTRPTTKKKLNLNDLIARCQHYNNNVRHEGVVGLKELLTANPDVLKSNLGAILERIAELILDKDQNVRGSVHKLFSQILPLVPAVEFSPFFSVVSAYLCCAMTHISDDIQLDSLRFLDLLLNFYPSLVTSRNSQLLDNFIQQISQRMYGGGQNIGKVTDISLLVNPASKLSSQNWRIKVLSRLRKFLKAHLDEAWSDDRDLHQKSCVEDVNMQALTAADTYHVLPLSSYAVQKNFSNPSLILRAQSSNHSSSEVSEDVLIDKEKLQNFVQMLIPLLLQCWVEAGPVQMATDLPGNALSSEGLDMLDCVLGVMQLLLQLVSREEVDDDQIKWMREQYEKDVVQYVMAHFPYSTPEKLPKYKIKGTKMEHLQVSSTSLNLAVCEVMVGFLPPYAHDAGSHEAPLWLSEVASYLQTRLASGRLCADHMETVIRVLRRLFISGLDQDLLLQLLEVMAQVSKSRPATSAEGKLMLQFFASLVSDPEFSLCNFGEMTIVCSVMQCFPLLLAAATGEEEHLLSFFLKTIARQAQSKDSSILKSLENNIHGILALLPGVGSPLQQQIIDLLYWTPRIDLAVWENLCSLCLHHDLLSRPTLCYLLQMLSARLGCETGGDTEYASAYLSFLITLTAGHTTESLHSLCEMASEKEVGLCVVLLEKSCEQCTRQEQTAAHASNEIGMFPNQHQVQELVKHVILDIMNSQKVVPLMMGISLLNLLCILTTGSSSPLQGDKLYLLGRQVVRMITCASTCDCDEQLAQHVQARMLSLSEHMVKSFPIILSHIIKITTSNIKEADNSTGTELVIKVFNKMLQFTSLTSTMSHHQSEMQALLALAQAKFGDRLCSQTSAEYSYGLSLLA